GGAQARHATLDCGSSKRDDQPIGASAHKSGTGWLYPGSLQLLPASVAKLEGGAGAAGTIGNQWQSQLRSGSLQSLNGFSSGCQTTAKCRHDGQTWHAGTLCLYAW